jgi:prolyl oligopeptidase
LQGKLIKELELPELGTVGGFSGKEDDAEAFYSFSSFIRPTTIYRLDMQSLVSEVFFTPTIQDFKPELYKTEQVWITSKDGTKVPMFLTYKKELKKGMSNPTLLYAYGGFDISLMPSFAVSRIPILESGGIYAVANLRGGGEFGKEWHIAGTKERKQNVFDDFAAAADYLVSEKYTDRDHLAIQGGSNGGLLIGATITQRPDICKVAFPAVGVLDMLRYHKFTIGWAWATDYGTSETKEGFDYLYKYSPVHNARPAAYPATLITTADHDDRVVPAHSFKFAAAMQSVHQGTNPMLIRIDVSAGHGAGKPTSKRIDEAADILSFMFFNMKCIPVIK